MTVRRYDGVCPRCRERPKQARHDYCRPCANEYARAYRAAGREKPLDAEARKRHNARKMVAMRVRRGTLLRGPCERCGDAAVEAHHDDYDRPAEVRWLCRRHHRAHHRGEFVV